MKIAVLIARFSISGVPLAQIRLAHAWAAAGHEVDLVIGYLPPGLTLPDTTGLHLVLWDKPKVRGLLPRLCAYLRRRRPDVVFSAEDHLNALALVAAILTGSRAKISGSSRVTPFDTYSNRPFSKRWFLKQIMRAVSWRADAQTCVSEDMVLQYRDIFPRAAHICVYNIVDDRTARSRMSEPVDDAWFVERGGGMVVAAGSLQPWKGFHDLIAAAALLRDRAAEVRIAILGEGPLRGELEAQIERLGLRERVRLLGHVANPLKYFARAHVFALTSRVEGMPNVLVEAMLCGCTPVATDCPTGPRELLQGGRYGHLVPVGDPAAIAGAIASALRDPVPPERLAEAVLPFREETVLRRHLATLGLSDAA